MWQLLALLIAEAIQSGPVFNGSDFGSCGSPGGQGVDLRSVMLLQSRDLVLDSEAGRVRIVLEGQQFRLHLLDSPTGDLVASNIGDRVSQSDDRTDLFLTLGLLDDRPVLYWRETFQHRSFRQGLLSIDPGATNADWSRVLTPLCEGRGGVDISH